MASAPTLGARVSGFTSDTWYSIQSFSSDYYLGLSNGSQPQVQLLSGRDGNSTLWQFIPAEPDTARGVYSLKSAASNGLYCLYASGDGPTAVPCATNAGQLQAFYASADGNPGSEVVLVPYPNPQSRAFSASVASAEGDEVDFEALQDFQSEPVEVLWAIQSRGTVDASVYPPVSAAHIAAPSAPSSTISSFSPSNLANTTSPAASATGNSTSSNTVPVVVVTASDGSTIPAPTGTPSPRPLGTSAPTSPYQSSVTFTITTDAPSSTNEAGSQSSTESSSATRSVETQSGNDAGNLLPTRAVWLAITCLALLSTAF